MKQKLQHLKEDNDVNPKDTQRGNIPQKKTWFGDKIFVQFKKKSCYNKHQIPLINLFQKMVELQKNLGNLY